MVREVSKGWFKQAKKNYLFLRNVGTNQQATQRHNSEDLDPQQQRSENLGLRKVLIISRIKCQFVEVVPKKLDFVSFP